MCDEGGILLRFSDHWDGVQDVNKRCSCTYGNRKVWSEVLLRSNSLRQMCLWCSGPDVYIHELKGTTRTVPETEQSIRNYYYTYSSKVIACILIGFACMCRIHEAETSDWRRDDLIIVDDAKSSHGGYVLRKYGTLLKSKFKIIARLCVILPAS